MDITEKHYEMLLGLDLSCSVKKVDLDVEKLRVDIYIEHVDNSAVCPECEEARNLYDHSPERTWRHLDTMQFETRIHCNPPRVKCEQHGIITACTPWAGRYSRFTLLFEDFTVKAMFKSFWDRRDASFARSYFDFWYREAFATKLPEIQAVARMLKKHLDSIITYFECYITNAFSEGINSMVQAIKANARGFRNFEKYRINILFFCGKLRLAS